MGGGDGIFISFHRGGPRVQGPSRIHTVTIPKALPPGPQRDSMSPSQNKLMTPGPKQENCRKGRAPLASQNQMYEPCPHTHCRPCCLRAVWLSEALAAPPLFRILPRTLLVVRPGWTSLQPCSPSHARDVVPFSLSVLCEGRRGSLILHSQYLRYNRCSIL